MCRLYTHVPMWDIFPGNSHNMLSIYSFCCDLCFVHVPKRKITACPFLFLYSTTFNYIFKTKLEAGIRCVLCVYACLHVLTDLNFHSENLCNFTLCMLYIMSLSTLKYELFYNLHLLKDSWLLCYIYVIRLRTRDNQHIRT